MKKSYKEIARERIEILFKQAEESLKSGRSDYTRRYISLARKIGMKTRQHISKLFQRRFCRKCNILWIPSKTVKVRNKKRDRVTIYTCLMCGAIKRYPYRIRKDKL